MVGVILALDEEHMAAIGEAACVDGGRNVGYASAEVAAHGSACAVVARLVYGVDRARDRAVVGGDNACELDSAGR